MLHDFRVRQRDFLLEISRAMTAQLDLGEVLRLILNASVIMLAGEVGLVALRELSGQYRIRATMGLDAEQIDMLNGQLEDLIAKGDGGQQTERISARMRRMAVALDPRFQQTIALPFVMHGEPLGLLIVFRAYRGSATPDDIQVLQSFADQAAIAVYNAQLYAGIDQERRRLAAILENSADGVMILDAQLHILSFNRAMERISGWTSHEAIDLPLGDVIRWARQDLGNLEAAIAAGWPIQPLEDDIANPERTLYVEGDLQRADQSILGVGITYAPLMARGRLVNIIANVRNITNFRRAQDMQQMFISTVSHELRTPITLIKGYASTLNRPDVQWNPEVMRDSLTVIEEEADRLNQLVDNLITASKLQARRTLDILPDTAYLDEVAQRSVERFQTQTHRHQILLNFPSDFPAVNADTVRIRQVIDNLVSNAIKYSPEGGKIEVGGSFDADHITIYVQDEGIGISAPDRERLFERFFRVDNALSRKTEGTGLGLYLSKAIVEAHGGHIDVDSAPGKGARFTFRLPR